MGSVLRVATYNVQSFRAGAQVAAAALGDAQPQVVLLQECGPRRRLRRFASAMRLQAVSSHRPFNRVRNAVLYPATWRLVRLDVRDFSRERRILRRGFIAAHLRGPELRLTAISAHLGLVARERERHARELTDYLAGLHDPIVVGVDLNEEPGGTATRWIGARFFDAWSVAGRGEGATFPSTAPSARIDYLFVGESLTAREAWVGDAGREHPPSDHRPVLADISTQER